MFDWLLKTHKLEKLYLILASALSLITALATFNHFKDLDDGFSIIGANPTLFTGLIVLISTLSLVVSGFLYYRNSKKQNLLTLKSKTKVMTTLKVVMAFVIFILITDLIILGLARAFMLGSISDRYPAESSFVVKMMYLVIRYSNLILTGIQSTLFLSLMGTLIGLFLAIFLVILRTQAIEIRDHEIIQFLKRIGLTLVKAYVTVIRGTPMIVQAMIFFYLMRQVFFNLGFSNADVNAFWTPFAAGLFTVSINTTAYLVEVLRGGIIGVDKGQIEAGRSLGFSSFKTYLLITFPQALRNSMPSIGNEFIVNIKDTAVLTLIQVVDLFAVTKTIAGNHYSFVEAFIIAAAIYLVLTYGTSKILMTLEKRLDIQSKEIVSSN